ncbi:hypothetical protein BGZ76_011632 [Entomortierella beljakovae]|nr:hypothetical protein BGZ76_011632 [Entomortierella beljakovae]
MAIVMGSMQVTNRLDIEDTRTKQIILGTFITSQLLVLGVHHIIQRRINSKNDTTPLSYTDQPKPFSNEEPKVVSTTIKAYDLEQNSQAQKQIFFSLALMIFLHFQFGVIRPLIVQSILPLKNVFDSKWAQIHLFDKPAEGDLKRPWKAESPFAALNEIKEGFKNETSEKPAIKESKESEESDASDASEEPKVESKKDI